MSLKSSYSRSSDTVAGYSSSVRLYRVCNANQLELGASNEVPLVPMCSIVPSDWTTADTSQYNRSIEPAELTVIAHRFFNRVFQMPLRILLTDMTRLELLRRQRRLFLNGFVVSFR